MPRATSVAMTRSEPSHELYSWNDSAYMTSFRFASISSIRIP